MGARLPAWLTGLIAGLFVLAMVAAPSVHARAVLDRAAFAVDYALPDGSLPDICSGGGAHEGPGGHLSALACLACIIIAAPGLAAAPSLAHGPASSPVLVERPAQQAVAVRPIAREPRQAQAPPSLDIA